MTAQSALGQGSDWQDVVFEADFSFRLVWSGTTPCNKVGLVRGLHVTFLVEYDVWTDADRDAVTKASIELFSIDVCSSGMESSIPRRQEGIKVHVSQQAASSPRMNIAQEYHTNT